MRDAPPPPPPPSTDLSLDAALDHLLDWLDKRYVPVMKKVVTPRDWSRRWEVDKLEFRELLRSVVVSLPKSAS